MVTEYTTVKSIPLRKSMHLMWTFGFYFTFNYCNEILKRVPPSYIHYCRPLLLHYISILLLNVSWRTNRSSQNQIVSWMWGATEVPDQAEGYASSLLLRAKLTEKEKFNLLRATSVTVAGIRAYGKARSSKEELEASILSFYLERIVLDLKYHEKGIAANLSDDIMKKRCYGVCRSLTQLN